MADEDGKLLAAVFSNEIIQVLHMRGDRERSATAALKGLEYMPLLPQFSGERCNVPGRSGPAVQHHHWLHPGPVFPHQQISHGRVVGVWLTNRWMASITGSWPRHIHCLLR